MQPSSAGKWTSIRFPFLCVAFAVGGPNDQRVITCCIRQPLGCPKRPGQIAAGIIDLSVAPRFSAAAAKFHTRDTAITTVGNPLHFNRSVQLPNEIDDQASGTSILDLVGVIKSGPQPCVS